MIKHANRKPRESEIGLLLQRYIKSYYQCKTCAFKLMFTSEYNFWLNICIIQEELTQKFSLGE